MAKIKTKASHAEQAAARNRVLKLATLAAESAEREAIGRLFTKDQRKEIGAFCKKHGVDHRQVIAEIIAAGMNVKGIGRKGKSVR